MLSQTKNYFTNYLREITIVAIMIAIAAWFWLQGYGLDVPKTPNTTVEWFWLPGHGWLVHMDVYYQTTVVIITMYILLVAFRAERFVRHTTHEEELSLELMQKIHEIVGSAMMDTVRMLHPSSNDERSKKRAQHAFKLYKAFSAFDTRWLYPDMSNYSLENDKGRRVIHVLNEEIMEEFPEIGSLGSQLLFLYAMRGFLAALDKSDHNNINKDDPGSLPNLYRKLKTTIMAFRIRLQNFSGGNKDSGEYDRLKMFYEIESDMDKFARSKQQGTDGWEWIMLGTLGAASIIFVTFLFPTENGMPIGDFFTVKLPAILISGVIGYLFIKLLKLENDRKNPIMGMTPVDINTVFSSTGDLHLEGIPKAYFGVVFDKTYDQKYSMPFSDKEFEEVTKKMEEWQKAKEKNKEAQKDATLQEFEKKIDKDEIGLEELALLLLTLTSNKSESSEQEKEVLRKSNAKMDEKIKSADAEQLSELLALLENFPESEWRNAVLEKINKKKDANPAS